MNDFFQFYLYLHYLPHLLAFLGSFDWVTKMMDNWYENALKKDINDLDKLASRDSSSEAAPENSRDAPKSNLNEEDTEVPTEFVTQGYLINEKLILLKNA